MKNLMRLVIAIFLLGSFSCSMIEPENVNSVDERQSIKTDAANNVNTNDNLKELNATSLEAAKAAERSVSDVYTFAGKELVGTSNLVRNQKGVSFNVNTTDLILGNAYTLWVVVFNNPRGCNENGCNEDEFKDSELIAAAGIDVMFGAGSLAGGTGKATFSGNRSEGDNSGSLFGPDAPGLIDSRMAEIHFVVRDHGPKIPGMIYEQISSFDGLCDVNACEDVQFAVHLPTL